MSRLPVKRLRKVQHYFFMWNYGTVQIWPYLGASKYCGHSVLQTPALVSCKFGENIFAQGAFENYLA